MTCSVGRFTRSAGRPGLLFLCLAAMLAWMMFEGIQAGLSMAADPSSGPGSTVSAAENHRETIETTINTETLNNVSLKTSLDQAEKFKKALAAEGIYNVQLSAYGNLMLQPQTTVTELEKARIDTLNARDAVDIKLKEISEKMDPFSQMLNQTQEQLRLNDKQLTDIDSAAPNDPLSAGLKKNLQTLISLLTTKQKRIEKILDIYQPLVLQLEETRKALIDLSEKLNHQITLKKKEALFQRQTSIIFALNPLLLRSDVTTIISKTGKLFTEDFRILFTRSFWETTGTKILTGLIFYCGILWGMLRILKIFRSIEKSGCLDPKPWRHLAFMLMEKTLILTGTTAFVAGYMAIQTESAEIAKWRVVPEFLWFWLLTQWGLTGMKIWNQLPLPEIPEKIRKDICFALRCIRSFGLMYVGLGFCLESSAGIMILLRMLFCIGLLAGYVRFWKSAEPHFSAFFSKFPNIRPAAAAAGYAVVGIGPVLELIGYGDLAIFWFTSCLITCIIGFWGIIGFMLLREWQMELKNRYSTDFPDGASDRHTLQWLGVRVLQGIWYFLIFIAVLMAWGEKNAVILNGFKIMNYPVPIGDMNISFLGVACSTLMLVITRMFTHLWRRLLRDKFLAGSGMDLGLKDSITTISIYLIWSVGIFLSLRMVGVSSTSLTVVFGAISIGLGFGLQNIFNNFISGIILLFERPIQVGDAVEIGGTWGVVQKINVRSTLVQTYDNASLIIPNSEFISNKVINWSFKDHRIRRVITIGVAYGSDTAMVAGTLTEIAGKTPWVLKQPEPDVLFSDFGDSALIFKLRIWTHVDHMVKVETHIRFEIERLFRERHIEIPFPQHDIHIIGKENAKNEGNPHN